MSSFASTTHSAVYLAVHKQRCRRTMTYKKEDQKKLVVDPKAAAAAA